MRILSLFVGFLLLGFLFSFAQEEVPPEIAVLVEVEAEKEKPVKVEEITAEKAKQAIGPMNFADVLSRLPGTQTIYGCAMNSPRLSFRGSTYTYLQMLVEGINVNPIGACVLQRVPWRSMAEIDVIRGPAPPSYPGNTISGLVSMKMKTGDKYPGTGFGITYGTYNTQIYDIVAGGGDERRNWFVAFNRSYNDGWMPNSRLDMSDLSFKVVNAPDDVSKWTIAGVFLHGEKGGFKPLGPNIAGISKFNPNTNKAELIGYAYEQRWPNLMRPGLSITYERKVGERTNMMFRISPVAVTYDLYFKRGLLKDTSQYEPDGTFKKLDKAQITEMTQKMRYKLVRAELNYDINLSGGNIFSWGIWWEGDWRKATQAVEASSPQPGAWSKRDMKYLGIFAQHTLSLGEGKALVWGARYDDTDPGGGAFVPFLDYHLKTTPTSDLRFSLTRNKRFPTLDELYGSGVNIGNPNLKPPIATIAQLDWENKLPNGKFTATLFYQKEKDKIVSDQNYQWQNMGRAKQQGLELSYEYNAGRTSFWCNYTYLDAWDLTNDMPLIPAYRTAPPKHMLKAGISVKGNNGLTYDVEFFYWGARDTNVRTSKLETWFDENGNIYQVTTPTSLSAAPIFNIRISKQLPSGRTLSLSIENIFDKQWQEMVFYPREGRWVKFSFIQKF
ncbi:TonB-dependent receptor [bacterium]|nr:TonB-dependent receptor [bacterium]